MRDKVRLLPAVKAGEFGFRAKGFQLMRKLGRLVAIGASCGTIAIAGAVSPTHASEKPRPVGKADRAASPPCYVSNAHLYCGNDTPIWVYGSADWSSNKVNTLRTGDDETSFFNCWVKKDHGHHWLNTVGDDNKNWGYVSVWHTHADTAFKENPGIYGMTQC